jgi:hypothetical protein
MSSILVVLVTGSRLYDDAETIKRELDACARDAAAGGASTLIIRHGACYPPPSRQTGRIPARSADWLTHLWIARFGIIQPLHILEEERPADWEGPCRPSCYQRRHGQPVNHRKPRGTDTYCPMAGKYRNRDMVLENPRPDRGIAFLLDNSSGTRHCIEVMAEFGIPVRKVPYRKEAHR